MSDPFENLRFLRREPLNIADPMVGKGLKFRGDNFTAEQRQKYRRALDWSHQESAAYEGNRIARGKAAETEERLGLEDFTPYERANAGPQGVSAEISAGVKKGMTRLGQTAAGIASLLPGKYGEEADQRRRMYKQRGEILDRYLQKSAAETGGGAGKGVSRSIEFLSDLVNPATKSKKAMGAWHLLRGYAPEKSASDAVISLGSNVAGEKIEDLTQAGNMTGNVIGGVLENGLQWVKDQFRADEPAPPPPSVPKEKPSGNPMQVPVKSSKVFAQLRTSKPKPQRFVEGGLAGKRKRKTEMDTFRTASR